MLSRREHQPAWLGVQGIHRFAEFGINPDQAAAFCIARKGALSKNIMRRGKVLGDWVDVHAKPEKLDGLKNKAGIASREIIKKDPMPATASEQVEPATTRKGSRRQRSMPPGKPFAERRLALALGTNRKLWPTRLRISTKERTLEGRDIFQSNPGKSKVGGETSLPAQMKKAGASRPSTD